MALRHLNPLFFLNIHSGYEPSHSSSSVRSNCYEIPRKADSTTTCVATETTLITIDRVFYVTQKNFHFSCSEPKVVKQMETTKEVFMLKLSSSIHYHQRRMCVCVRESGIFKSHFSAKSLLYIDFSLISILIHSMSLSMGSLLVIQVQKRFSNASFLVFLFWFGSKVKFISADSQKSSIYTYTYLVGCVKKQPSF